MSGWCVQAELLDLENRGQFSDELVIVVYYETIKRELNKRLIYECRCDERLKDTGEGSTCLTYTGLSEGLEHLKIETKLINERFSSVFCFYY